ncbi:MAG: phage holin family protein [Limosilactobacillus sp.]|uniref:phage holin family protein n=1 Tax=Limosilactobacillus sp. TaxID=2773925 RepID=UPI0026F7680B|nr:phage holin family protein [Limosilactobacillus sp.]
MTFAKKVLINTILFIALAGLFTGTGLIYVSHAWVAFLAAFVLGALNVMVKPVLLALTLPINVLTLGFFSVVINGIMLELTSMVIGESNFSFSSFWGAMLIAIIMSICNAVIADHQTD